MDCTITNRGADWTENGKPGRFRYKPLSNGNESIRPITPKHGEPVIAILLKVRVNFVFQGTMENT
jgi:hypothetical protein